MLKRTFDFCVSLMIIIILSPIIVLVAIFVFVFIGSPIIFVQERPGKNKVSFNFYKFRSMTNETDENGNLLPNEDRLTKAGKFLRKTSLDELPSLINVLKGDMSLVGPRPLRTRYNSLYTKEQNLRHNVKPGITGLAQVNGRTAISWDEKFDLDVKYVRKQTFLLDLKILIKTVLVVLVQKDVSPENKGFEVPFDEYILKNEKKGTDI